MKSLKSHLKKIKSDFLTHKFDDVLNNFPNVIELLNQEKNVHSKNYRKIHIYSIVYLIYRLKEKKEEANIYLQKMKELEIDAKKLSNRLYYDYIPFTRMGIKILFKKKYYQETYSKELLDEIRYDSGELGFIEDLFIVEGSDTVGILKMITKYLTVAIMTMGITIWFVKIGMIETAIAFFFLSCISFYVYSDYMRR